MKRVLAITAVLVLALIVTGCSNADDKAYQRGYEEGYAEGRQASLTEKEIASETAEAGYQKGYSDGYKVGYNNGLEEGSKPYEPIGEVVKVLSYNLVRDTSLWVEVVGELQNSSNSTVSFELSCALVDSEGKIVATGSSYEHLNPKERAFFTIGSFYQQPKAVDARFTIKNLKLF